MNLLYANDKKGAYPHSYYAATATPFAPCPVFKGEAQADICVIGGGYTGLSSALHLAEAGYKVVLLEAQRLGFGASGRNGGQVGSGQRQDQLWLEAHLGQGDARRMWDLGEAAKALVKSRIKRHAMPVTFHAGVAHACRSASELRHAQELAEKMAQDYDYHEIDTLDQKAIRALIGSDDYIGGDLDHGAGHLHPLNFALGLAQAAKDAGVQLYEGSEVHDIRPGPKPVVSTASGKIHCDQVVLACNGYLGGLSGPVAARVMPINNFIIATEPLGERAAQILSKPVAVADSRFVVNYWRLSEDNRLLFGGGESYGYRFPDITSTVMKPMLQVYPQLKGVKVDYAWGGTLAITMNRMPYFARPAANVWSASGYSGHGVAMATLAGQILSQAIRGQMESFDLMAKLPAQRFPGGPAMRQPLLALAMTYYALRDRMGF